MLRWVLKVEREHRLILQSEIVERIPWLAGATGSVVAVAVVGGRGELRVLAPGSRESKLHDDLARGLARVAAAESVSVVSGREVLARYSSNATRLTFTKNGRKFYVAMPRELRALEVAPSRGNYAVAFVFGSSVEIWRAEGWRQHMREAQEGLEGLIEECAEDLGLDLT